MKEEAKNKSEVKSVDKKKSEVKSVDKKKSEVKSVDKKKDYLEFIFDIQIKNLKNYKILTA